MKLKYTLTTLACLAAMSSSAWADMEVTVTNSSNVDVEIPSAQMQWPGVSNYQNSYIGKDATYTNSPDTEWVPAPTTGTLFGPGQFISIGKYKIPIITFSYALDHDGGEVLTSEVRLDVYTQQQAYLGSCYLINSSGDNGQGLEHYPLGYASDDSQNYMPSFPMGGQQTEDNVTVDNQCPWLNLTVNSTGGPVNPNIVLTLNTNSAMNPTITSPLQMTTTLLQKNYANGDNLYRVDIQSAVYQFSNLVNNFSIGPYHIYDNDNGQNYYLLPPLKVLNTSNNTSTNNYQYQESHASFYLVAPAGNSGNDIQTWPQMNDFPASGSVAGTNATLSGTDPTANYSPADFVINITPLISMSAVAASSGGQINPTSTEVYSNGMDQAPFRVSIYYAPASNGSSPVEVNPQYLISPYYHPELMFLYQQVYFESYAPFSSSSYPTQGSGTLITNAQASYNNASGYTVMSNYPGPYVAVPGGDMWRSNSYDENTADTSQSRPQIYYLSTTSTSDFSVGAVLSINGTPIYSDTGSAGLINIQPDLQPTGEGLVQQNSSHLVVANYQSNGNAIPVPIYNVNKFNAQNSAAVHIKQAEDEIIGVGNYNISGVNGTENTSNVPNVTYVNSDGSLSITDQSFNSSISQTGLLKAVDIYGYPVSGKIVSTTGN